MDSGSVTVCVPSIPPRAPLLARALASVAAQVRLPDAVSVAIDRNHDGPAITRNRALEAADTEWVAFLDDDDELYPDHLARLLEHQAATGADLVYPWFNVVDGDDPFPQHFGVPWDAERVHIFPITYLVRTELAKAAWFPTREEMADDWAIRCDDVRGGEDWGFVKRLLAAGAEFAHLPERTWAWHHHGRNCSGLSWDKVYG